VADEGNFAERDINIERARVQALWGGISGYEVISDPIEEKRIAFPRNTFITKVGLLQCNGGEPLRGAGVAQQILSSPRGRPIIRQASGGGDKQLPGVCSKEFKGGFVGRALKN